MSYKVIKEHLEEYVELHKGFIEFNDDDIDALEEDIRDIAENDGRCTCTSGVGPECPCAIAMKIVHGGIDVCRCGIFRRPQG